MVSTHLICDIPPCVQALELQFFQQNLVQEALSLHGVSQSNWNLIYYELSKRVKKVPEIVARRASQMQPNPYGPPYKPFLLQEIVESVLLAVFKETLLQFSIYKMKITRMKCSATLEISKIQSLFCVLEILTV